MAVATAGIGPDEHTLGLVVRPPAQHLPPAPNARHCKVCRLVSNANIHERFVVADAVRADETALPSARLGKSWTFTASSHALRESRLPIY